MPRGIPEDGSSKTAERDAAREKRNQSREEISLMLGWLTRRYPVDAHLAPARQGSGWQVVCVHEGNKRLCWRVSDLEALAWFEHLKTSDCKTAGTRAEKLAALADLATTKP